MSSEYMAWAKTRAGARYNLATSGVASLPLAERCGVAKPRRVAMSCGTVTVRRPRAPASTPAPCSRSDAR
jgi:predicted RecA/RadA family phage recombinase